MTCRVRSCKQRDVCQVATRRRLCVTYFSKLQRPGAVPHAPARRELGGENSAIPKGPALCYLKCFGASAGRARATLTAEQAGCLVAELFLVNFKSPTSVSEVPVLAIYKLPGWVRTPGLGNTQAYINICLPHWSLVFALPSSLATAIISVDDQCALSCQARQISTWAVPRDPVPTYETYCSGLSTPPRPFFITPISDPESDQQLWVVKRRDKCFRHSWKVGGKMAPRGSGSGSSGGTANMKQITSMGFRIYTILTNPKLTVTR